MAKKSVQKYVLQQSLHMGFIRESFTAGTVIEKIEEGKLKIAGKVYDSSKDLDILIRKEWVKPYSETAVEEAKKKAVKVLAIEKLNVKEELPGMKIVQSDADLMDKEIDIKHTKTAKKDHTNKKDTTLKVIKADEGAEERLDRLHSEKKVMPIVQDDSLGEVGGMSLNAGAVKVISPEDKAKLDEAAKQKAAALKAQLGSGKEVAKKRGRPRKVAVGV